MSSIAADVHIISRFDDSCYTSNMNMRTKRQARSEEPADTGSAGQDLAELWSNAIIFAPHLAGCTCSGGFCVPLDPAMVEEDLIDYLHNLYRNEGLDELAAFTAARNARRGEVSFPLWLRALDEAPLAGPDRVRLMADIRTTLESMCDTRAKGDGFICY